MRAGQLRHRVTLQSFTATQNGYGEESRSYSDSATAWASIEPVTAAERLDGGQVSPSATHRIRFRERTDITPTMRLKFGTRTFEVVGPIMRPAERKIAVEVMVAERL